MIANVCSYLIGNINAINSKYTVEAVSYKVHSDTYYLNGSFSCAKSGYKPIGIVGWHAQSGANYTFPRLYISGTTVIFTLCETQQKTWSADMTIHTYILYEKI